MDIKNSPSGKRYAYGGVATEKEGEEMKNVSGLLELNHSQMPRYYAKASLGSYSKLPKEKIRRGLKALLEETPFGEMIDVRIRVVDDLLLEHTWQSLDREFGLGNIKTQGDLEFKRKIVMQNRRTHFNRLKAPIVTKLNTLGVDFVSLENLLFIHAKLSRFQIKELEKMSSILSMSISHKGQDQSGTQCPITSSWLDGVMDGVEVVQGSQIQQFLCGGFDAQPASGAYHIAVIESGVSKWGHAFQKDWANGPNRFVFPAQGCGFFYCDTTFGDTTDHATWTSDILAGDLTQNQQSSILNSKKQVERSGDAPEAIIHGYALENGSASFELAANHVLGLSVPILAANISWGTKTSYPLHDCDGDWDEDEAVNGMYEAGVFVVKAAGNESGNGPDCRIGIPGSAISSFTVGGHAGSNGSINQVRNGSRYYVDDDEGTSYGRENGRDVVSISATASRSRLPSGNSSSGTVWNTSAIGTRFSAPTVTAAAANFADFYQTTFNSAWILNPGAMYSSMLLMGDRGKGLSTTGVELGTGFDPIWGSGRMLMRMFNGAGMDSPASYGRYSVCVDNQEEVEFDLFDVPADVDSLNVVAHWHDRRHDIAGIALSDVDLRLEVRSRATDNLLGSRSSLSAKNNKERIFYPMSAIHEESHVKIKLYGYGVSSNNEGCGNASTKVYISWYYEDKDRDDWNGPGSEILPQ